MKNQSAESVLFTDKQKNLFFIVACFAIPFSGLGIDIYTPSLPAIHQFFGVSAALAKLTISAFLLGLGLFQLVAGPVSDSVGRKRPLLWGLIAFSVFSFLSTRVTSIHALLLIRFLQGAAVSFPSVAGRAIISDIYVGNQFKKRMNVVTMVWAMGPIIAPFLGGYLQHAMGWHGAFYFLMMGSLISVCVALLFYRETRLKRSSLQFVPVLKRYARLLSHGEYMAVLLCQSCLYSALIFFGVLGPFVIQSQLHYSSIAFGYFALLIGLAWFLGTTTNRFLIHFDEVRRITVFSLLGMFSAVLMLALALLGYFNLAVILFPMFLLTYCGGIIFPNFFARCIELFPEAPATANALMASVIMLMGGVLSSAASLLKSNLQLSWASANMVFYGVFLVVFLVFLKARLCHDVRA